MGVSLCSIKLLLRFFPGVKAATRRWSSALRAALAWGVGALLRAPPPEAEVPRRMDWRRPRVTLRSRGVWTAARRAVEGGSALMARRLGVRVVVVAVVAGVLAVGVTVGARGVESMVLAGGRAWGRSPADIVCWDGLFL